MLIFILLLFIFSLVKAVTTDEVESDIWWCNTIMYFTALILGGIF